MRIMMGGDVMLGRLVKEVIIKEGYDYPLKDVIPILQRGDLTIINLECAISDHEQTWSGAPKAFYFGAPSSAAQALSEANVDLVNLANNHMLDFNFKGLSDTLKNLHDKQIQFTGAGLNIKEAQMPALIKRKGIQFGMVGFCDHQSDFAATDKTPGIAYLDLNHPTNTFNQLKISLNEMKSYHVDWPILSLHWGPNMVDRPSQQFIHIAHRAIEMGYKIIFGHSAHVFHGIEIYQGCPIIYAAGDFVDDYAVDPYFKNDHQLLFELDIEKTVLKRIFLYPIFIEWFKVRPATGKAFQFIAERMQRLSKEMGTTVEPYDEKRLVINPNI